MRADAQPSDSADGADAGDVPSDLGADAPDSRQDDVVDSSAPPDVVDVIDATVSMDATDAGDASDVADARDASDVINDSPSTCMPDARLVDAAVVDGRAPNMGSAGVCAENNGGCSAFATCEQLAPCLRRCVCAPGLTIKADGSSCEGLLLVSRTSTTRPGSSDGMRSSEPFIANSGRYVAFSSGTIAGPGTTHCYVADVVTGAIRDVSAVGGAHGGNCRAPHVSNDGNRAVFISRGQVPMDSVPADFTNPGGSDWIYYRDGTAPPQRLDAHREVTSLPYVQHGDGYTDIDVSNDGRRAVISTRWNIDPMSPFDGEVNLFSISIPMVAGEPLKESVNSNRSNAPEGPVGGNIFGGVFSADGNIFTFHTQKQFENYRNLGTDIFGRRLGIRASMAGTTMLLAPLEPLADTRDVNQTSWVAAPNGDGSVVAFASYASVRGVPAGRMRFYVAQQRPSMLPIVRYTGLETAYSLAAAVDWPEVSLSADARYLVIASRENFTQTGEVPADTNGTSDLYLFDVSTATAPVRLGRVNVAPGGTDPPVNMAALNRYYSRIAADGASVVFSTTQPLVADDTNNDVDVYLRVYR